MFGSLPVGVKISMALAVAVLAGLGASSVGMIGLAAAPNSNWRFLRMAVGTDIS